MTSLGTLPVVKPVDNSKDYLLDEVELLKQELAKAHPGYESALLRLLSARVTMNHTFQFCGLCDSQGVAWESNHTSIQAVGVKRSEVHGLPFWETRWWNYSSAAQEQLKAAIARAAQGEFVRYDVEALGGADGQELRIFDFNLNPIRDRQGNVVFMTVEGRDVTEQRHLEREVAQLREQAAQQRERELQTEAQTAKENLEKVLAGIKDQFLVLDQEWRYTYVNDRVTQVVGKQKEELLGKKIWELFPDTVGTPFYGEVHRAMAEQTPVHFEYFYAPLNRWFENHIYPSPTGVTIFVTDISDRKQVEAERQRAEQALQQSEERYRLIFETTGFSLWEEDFSQVHLLLKQLKAQGVGDLREYLNTHPEIVQQALQLVQIRDVNQQTLKMFGAATKAELFNSLTDVFVPETLSVFVEELITLAEDRRYYKSETILKTLQGEQRHVLFTVIFPAPEAGYERVVVSLIDITERKQAEEALRQSEERSRLANERFELATAAVNCMIYDWSIEQDTVQRTEGLTRLLGYSMEEAEPTGAWWHERVHPEDLQRVQQEAAAVLVTSDRYTGEYRVRNKANQYVYVVDHAIVGSRDASGCPNRIVGSTVDINERKQAEAALRESAERLNLALTAADMGDWSWDAITDLVTFSGRAAEIFGIPSGPYMTWTQMQQLLHEDDRDRTRLAVEQAILERSNYDVEYRITRPDGSQSWVAVKGRAQYTHSGQVLSMLGVLQDISDRKQAEQEREHLLERERTARQDAEAANRIKDEFLAVLSHELRSPLNPIIGWARLLQTRKFDQASLKQALATIERNARLQTQLIEDLLDVSRILRGKLSLKMAPVKLVSAVEAALETVQLAAEAKAIQIQTRFDSTIRPVLGDAARLQQVVWNLLSNAVKFTPEGGRVEVQLVNMQDAYAQITVSDTGKGIKPDFLPYVFDTFRQADSTTTRQFGGLGLGLAIVRHLVELHGGTVSVDSLGEGQGATFTVRLPFVKSSQGKWQPNPEFNSPLIFQSSALPLTGLQILVVDDDLDSRDFLSFVLEQSGAIVTAAASASEALQLLAQSKPDLLLSDIGMPEMDGYTLMRQIRSLEAAQPVESTLCRKANPVIGIALTAYASEIDQQQALAAGFQHHIAKPVMPEELIEKITHHCSVQQI